MSDQQPLIQKKTKRVYSRAPGHKPADMPGQAIPVTSGEWITIGQVVAPFGIRGEVKMYPQTDFPERIVTHPFLYLGPEHAPFRPLEARPHGKIILLRLQDVTDANTAETLRGKIVMIPANEIASLDSDQFFIHQLIGLQATHINGTPLGTVADIFSGAQDLLVIRNPGKPDVLVPLVKALVPTVDIPNRIIVIDPPEGLFEGQSLDEQE
jgi:16S rRNA processing protein RimM